jgi:plastocyanin
MVTVAASITTTHLSMFRRLSAGIASFCFLVVVVAAAEATDTVTITLPWCKPSTPGSYERRQAREGDTVEFDWLAEYHNAVIYPSGDCLDSSDREFLGEQPGASYTFTAEDVGTSKTFVCSVSNHCAQGQLVVFDVLPSTTEDIDYLLSTPCGGEEGVLKKDRPLVPTTTNEPPLSTEEIAVDSLSDSAGGRMAAGAVAVATIATTTVLSVLG